MYLGKSVSMTVVEMKEQQTLIDRYRIICSLLISFCYASGTRGLWRSSLRGFIPDKKRHVNEKS